VNEAQLLAIMTAALLSDGQADQNSVDLAIERAARIYNRVVDRKPREKQA